MAKLVVCSVRDRAVDAFMRPFTVPTIGMAVRSFQDEVNKSDNPMNKHPEDYELHKLGFFDEESGEFVNEKQMLAVAKDYLTPRN